MLCAHPAHCAADSTAFSMLSRVKQLPQQLSIHHSENSIQWLQYSLGFLHSNVVLPVLPFWVYIHVYLHVHGQRLIPVIPRVLFLTGLKSRDWVGKLASEHQGSNCPSPSSIAYYKHMVTYPVVLHSLGTKLRLPCLCGKPSVLLLLNNCICCSKLSLVR